MINIYTRDTVDGEQLVIDTESRFISWTPGCHSGYEHSFVVTLERS